MSQESDERSGRNFKMFKKKKLLKTGGCKSSLSIDMW